MLIATWLKCEKASHHTLPFALKPPPIPLAPVPNQGLAQHLCLVNVRWMVAVKEQEQRQEVETWSHRAVTDAETETGSSILLKRCTDRETAL